MNNVEPFVNLHASTAAELSGLLDVEAGLREALIAAQHTRTAHDVNLDVEQGLRAITADTVTPPLDAPLPRHPQQSAQSESPSAVAALLISMGSTSRLVLRNHPAIAALALSLGVAHARAKASTLSRDLDPARNVAHAHVHSLDRARDLERALDHLDRDLGLLRTRDLNRGLNRGFNRVIHDRLRELARALAHAHTFALALVLDLDRRAVNHRQTFSRAQELEHALERARVYAGDLPRTQARSLGRDLDEALERDLDNALQHDLAPGLARARHDFTGADLSDVDLNTVSLIGVRWSMATKWPSDEWRAQALLNSLELSNGTYEIRGGTTNVPSHST